MPSSQSGISPTQLSDPPRQPFSNPFAKVQEQSPIKPTGSDGNSTFGLQSSAETPKPAAVTSVFSSAGQAVPNNPFGKPSTAFSQKSTISAFDDPFSSGAKRQPSPFDGIKIESGSTSAQGFSGTFSPADSGNKKRKNVAFSEREATADVIPRNGDHHPEPPKIPNGPQSEYARKIQDHLRKAGIKEPQWPSNPGDPSKRGVLDELREAYKKYREQARKSLQKAGLIDDPTVARRLDEAIDFKGICEDMCSDFEKLTRIVQFDVKSDEKVEGPDGTLVASTPHMVKALARSAAGQELPLPMDVRSLGALKRTLDYLIDEVLVEDHNLPTKHGFLWDRTRAIRRDFVFHTTKTEEELALQVYCLENITRFHVVALHLLSQKSFAAPDFSEQQEREQLSKAVLSLTQTYDDCKAKGVECKNEAEFRAYFILLNSHYPDFQLKVTEWDQEFWYLSDEVQTALSLSQAMQSIFDWHGPLRSGMPVAAASAFTTYFRIMEDPSVSYTMACFAEIHLAPIRRNILKNVQRAYSRGKDSPKDITLTVLNKMLRFDSEEEAVEFSESHGLKFSRQGASERYLVLDRNNRVGNPTTRQSFSFDLVERKRGARTLPEVIHTTIFEDADAKRPEAKEAVDNDSLFVENAIFNDAADKPKAQDFSIAKDDSATTFSPPNTFPTSSIFQSATSMAPSPAFGTMAAPQPPSHGIFQQPPAKSSATPGHFATTQSTPPPSKATEAAKVPPLPPHPAQARKAEPPTLNPAGPSTSPVQDAPTITVSPPTPRLPSSSSTPPSHISPQPHIPAPGTAVPPKPAQPAFPSTISKTLAPSAGRHVTFAPVSSATTESSVVFTAQDATKTAAIPSPVTSLDHARRAAQTVSATPKPPSPPPDLMGDFTRWFMLGDKGLWHEFLEAYTEHLCQDVFLQFQQDEEIRMRKEEDERSWAEALKFRRRSLRTRFFNRWRTIARNLALNRRARDQMAEMRAYQQRRIAEQRAATKRVAAEAEATRRASQEVNLMEELRASKELRTSMRMEQALLATGVFNGVRDAKETAAGVVRDASVDSRTLGSAASKIRQRVKDGFTSSVSKVKGLVRTPSNAGAVESMADRSASPSSVVSMRSTSTAATGSIRYKRQKVPNKFGKMITKLVKVSPAPKPQRITNFSQSRRTSSLTEESISSTRTSGTRFSHWRLRAAGMVQMPNGQYLHESLAIPMRNGQRFPELGDYGLPPPVENRITDMSPPPLPTTRGSRMSEDFARPTTSPPIKRKRESGGDTAASTSEWLRQRLAAEDDSPPTAKKQRAWDGSTQNSTATTKFNDWDPADADSIIHEMREAAAAMDEGEGWFREQNELMDKGLSAWDR
jgi:nuclear mRNA export protein SAC3